MRILLTCTFLVALTVLLNGCTTISMSASTAIVVPKMPPTASPMPPSATPTRLPTNTPTLTPTDIPKRPSETATKLATAAASNISAPSPLSIPPAAAGSQLTAVGARDLCLGCHGPYNELIAATAKYVMPSGEIASPHIFDPHNSKNIPFCIRCHDSHPIPLNSKEGLPKPRTEWCYTCHHKGVLQCHTCHE